MNFVLLAWMMIIYPSNTNRQAEQSVSYADEATCSHDMEAKIAAYVSANGGDTSKTRAACVEQK